MKTIKPKSISYDPKVRDYKNVKYIALHYTSNKGDTAENNGNFFKNVNTEKVGTHFIVDQKGNVVKSVTLNHAAWAVGGGKYSDCNKTGGGKYYKKCTNANSVSIELCDIVDKKPSDEMVAAVWRTIKYIRKYCPNAQTIIRHFDVNGKHCPASMVDPRAWDEFQLRLLKEALKG